ncbi:MAG: potassium transporter TrkG, partial [Lysobacteraceae bacterium]
MGSLVSERARTLQRLLGAIVALSGMMSLPPAALAWWWGEATVFAFLESFLVPFAAGLVLWFPVRNAQYELRLRDGFLIVSAAWIIACLVTALPFVLAPPHLSYTDAVFEATSGLTTTGATVITGIEHLPRSVLFFRSSLNYFGGMGIVILAVAILPMLRVGGMQLFRLESSDKSEKVLPRANQIATGISVIYAILTALCALVFWDGGM